ncbi:hypothetical protein [Streptomyces sp. CC210A]|uniref:hypothetical protein n=1 Tax=Streptomyces sp. CC210A TaxID=2898184 RepID=UPI001F29B3D7|nr:hypothetical protein [Streptomyces sp. CC210A]
MSGHDDAPGVEQPPADGPGDPRAEAAKDGRGAAHGDQPQQHDKDTADEPRQTEARLFDQAGRSTRGAGGTGGAGTARAARRVLAPARELRRYVMHGDGQVLHDNTIINLYGTGAAGGRTLRGTVPQETLDRLDEVYCEPAGYQRMKDTLRTQRLLVLCGEPGSGRGSTALALLAELTGGQVTRLDPSHAVHEITEDGLAPGHGHLLHLPPQDGRPDPQAARPPGGEQPRPRTAAPGRLTELHLDRFAELLHATGAYGIVLVDSSDLADRLLQGRYGLYCPAPEPAGVLLRHLRILLRDAPEGALDEARALAADGDVTRALGLDRLRPREAAGLAALLARRQRGELADTRLLEECGAFVRAQVRAWFAGADRPGTVPEALPALGAAAFRIAVAVFDRGPYSLATEAAELLAWDLAVTLDPGQPVGRRLFGTHADLRPALARCVLEDGEIEMGTYRVPARLVRFQGGALATEVLHEVWHGHHNARGPVSRWLRGLCDDPRPAVWVRASLTAGVLCSWDWLYGFRELVGPLAGSDDPVTRMAAATAVAEAARNPLVRPAAADALKEWEKSGDAALLHTAILAHGYALPAGSVRASLGALGTLVRAHRDDEVDALADVLGAAAFSVTRLLASQEPETVLARLRDWLRGGRRILAMLADLAVVETLTTRTTHLWGLDDVPALEPHGPRPLLVALLATRPDLAPELAALVGHALSAPYCGAVALDGLGTLLRRAARDPEALDLVCGALLPRLAPGPRDRDRLFGLITALVRDRDRPLDKTAAGRMWDAVAEGAER